MNTLQKTDPNLRFIVTGGPGFGKTTLIEALQARGIHVFPEGARELITMGYPAPIRSKDSQKGFFFHRIREKRINDYHQCQPLEIGFYDRGLPDSIAFSRFMDAELPEKALTEIRNHPYNRTLFITPVWPEIFTNDQIRTESLENAIRLHHLIIETYTGLGYSLIDLPKASPEERVDFILDILRNLLGDKMVNDISLLQ